LERRAARVTKHTARAQALKEVLAAELQSAHLWHDTARRYPAVETVTARDIVLIPDWTQHDPEGRTPEAVRLQPLPEDEEVAECLRTRGAPSAGAFSLQALLLYLSRQFVEVEPSLDLMYAVRPERSGKGEWTNGTLHAHARAADGDAMDTADV
jgi:hypothetical protein